MHANTGGGGGGGVVVRWVTIATITLSMAPTSHLAVATGDGACTIVLLDRQPPTIVYIHNNYSFNAV